MPLKLRKESSQISQYVIFWDTVLTNKAVNNAEYPFGVHKTLEFPEHVVVPDELAAGGRGQAGIGSHLTLQREGQVIRIAGGREGRGGARVVRALILMLQQYGVEQLNILLQRNTV